MKQEGHQADLFRVLKAFDISYGDLQYMIIMVGDRNPKLLIKLNNLLSAFMSDTNEKLYGLDGNINELFKMFDKD